MKSKYRCVYLWTQPEIDAGLQLAHDAGRQLAQAKKQLGNSDNHSAFRFLEMQTATDSQRG